MVNLELVEQHIQSLKNQTPKWIPYGGGNPYSYCEDCHSSIVNGHHEDCKFYSTEELISSLEELYKSWSGSLT